MNLEVVKLPSGGLCYDEKANIPEEVTIRPFKTADEKSLYGTGGVKGINNLLTRCIVEPKDLDVNQLTAFDKTAILMKLRSITLGSKYKFKTRCPHCKTPSELEVDLNEFPVSYLDETMLPITCKLPNSEDVLELRFISEAERTRLDKSAERNVKKLKNVSAQEELYILRLVASVAKVNEEELDAFKLRDYIENMSGMDSAYLHHTMSGVDVGVDMTVEVECPNNSCGEYYDALVSPGYEFFRPEF